ncbi:MAG: hypothetical protein P9M14_07930 [Candidatus Alcyoniella australis]|nr:hypothetical protein [Candidatus Alcyoniella australis]
MFYTTLKVYIAEKFRSSWKSLLLLFVLCAAIFSLGLLLGGFVFDGRNDPGELLFTENWDGHESGKPPGDPWDIYNVGDNGVAQIFSRGQGMGKSFSLRADAPSDITVAAALPSGPLKHGTLTAAFDVLLEQGENLGFVLIGSGSSNHAYALLNGEEVLTQDSKERMLACGSFTPGTWINLRIVADIDRQTYSVFVNGHPGECRDVSWVNHRESGGDLQSFAAFIGPDQSGSGRMDHLLIYHR